VRPVVDEVATQEVVFPLLIIVPSLLYVYLWDVSDQAEHYDSLFNCDPTLSLVV
jgi:hypothetical protein